MQQDIKVDAFLANLPLFKEASTEEIERIAVAVAVTKAPGLGLL